MVSFQLYSFGFMRCSELEENLTIGSINPSFTKNNKLHYVTPVLPGTCSRGKCAPGASVASGALGAEAISRK